jgi:transposase
MHMAKRKFQLTEKQIQELRHAHAQCKDGPTRSRLLAVRLYGTNYPAEEVREIAGCSQSSLMGWCRKYREGGVSTLEDHRLGGNRAELTKAEIEHLRTQLHAYTPRALFGPEAATLDGQFWTVEDLQRAVQSWYQVAYRSRSSYLRLFALCGFSYHRPTRVFKSRREADVAAFEEQLEKTDRRGPR